MESAQGVRGRPETGGEEVCPPREPIAIVGIGCRFAGALDRSELWELLLDGRDCVSEIPADRFGVDAFYDPRPGKAGKTTARWAGAAVGAFMGQTGSDYGDLVASADPSRTDSVYQVTGSARSNSSGRISYALDLRGPSPTIDTARSSSLLAVHLACQSMWSGESTMAFAGGANLIFAPLGISVSPRRG